MQQRTLGSPGPKVSALGLGCMGMSFAYGPSDDAESEATLKRAIDLKLSPAELAAIAGAVPQTGVAGERYTAADMAAVNR